MSAPLAEHEVANYHEQGFLRVERLADPAAVEELRSAYDELIDAESRAAGDRMLGGITRQVMAPSDAHRTFAWNDALASGVAMGEQLLGEPVERVFDMLIYKPAGHPHATPWHQDMAYAGLPTAAAGSTIPLNTLQFWMALDDADEENGCMHFVPKLHTEPLIAHVVAGGEPDDPGRLLAIDEPERLLDLDSAVAVPLPAGGCTIHSYGTPHFTPPNRSTNRPRRAYIFNLAPTTYVEDFRRRRTHQD